MYFLPEKSLRVLLLLLFMLAQEYGVEERPLDVLFYTALHD